MGLKYLLAENEIVFQRTDPIRRGTGSYYTAVFHGREYRPERKTVDFHEVLRDLAERPLNPGQTDDIDSRY